jgi:TPP-dependent pyruvate/acetoin dehydrogenase alpha subunit
MSLSREDLIDSYRQMRTIRRFEERLVDLVTAGKLAGFLHLYAGQEAVAVGVCQHLDDRDIVYSIPRFHVHCIA